MVEGITCIMGHTARVLFDPGAIHSFVSAAFASKLNKKAEPLEFQLIISTSLGAEMTANKCEVMIGEVKTWADLVRMGGMEYDAILGMDWLSNHHAHVDFYHMRVTFKMTRTPEFTFEGVKNEKKMQIISAFKTTKLLRRGCQGFLAIMMDKKETELKVRRYSNGEYPNVFSEELSGLRPDREIEFSINMLPGLGPISKAPYRMALTEMKELKEQLQELLDKEFIRPSASHWGAQCYLLKRRTGV